MPKTVLFFSEVNWDYLKQRHHFFTENYSLLNNVYYFGKIGLRYPRFKEVFNFFNNSKYIFKSKVNTNINLRTNINFPSFFFLPPISKLFNFLNKYFLIRMILNNLELENHIIIHYYQPTQLIIDIIEYLEIKSKKLTIVYDCVQDYRYHPASNQKILNNEKILVKRSDLVLADSVVNLNRLKQYKKVILIEPGVEISNFKLDVKKINKKKISILYYGNIRNDLDFDLLNKISSNNSIKITLLGQLNCDKKSISDKIIVKMAVPYEKLKKEISNHDALILPYKLNKFTNAIIPAKFFECLATNMPIISTDMRATKKYHNLLYIINNNNFNICNTKINKTITNKYLKVRDELLRKVSWKEKFNEFYQKI